MKSSGAIVVCCLYFFPLSSSAHSEQPWRIYGSNAGRNVRNWVRIISPGPATSPFPIVWISNEKIIIDGFPEISLVVSRYRMAKLMMIVSKLKCSNSINAEIIAGSIQVFSRDRGRVIKTCKLNPTRGCDFLRKVYRGIQAEPIYNISYSINCPVPSRAFG